MDKTVRRKITIINKLGLHARAAAKLVTLATGFDAAIYLCRGSHKVNAKSIMGIMMMAVGKGTELEIVATGKKAQKAVDKLEELINNRFGEGE
ncbi:MAG: HPr family phosphocarrier protein [Gammaproteobacteria bacterium]|nr:HPr family phosphocarrier protein [Gammaproteobacteria bacterium]